ncbi:MAG TPA: flagellin [Opitutaceae bacterium]|nr:flagellin [Opitutaceae bacterium]
MSVVINTNYAATIAANNLASSTSSLQKSLNRLSSGSKIVSPSDDAGGLAVSMKLSAAANRSDAASANIGNVTSLLQTQDGVLQTAGKVLDRMSQLWTLYQDPTKNSSDLSNYDAEFKQLQKELDSLSKEKFNNISLFGTATTTADVSQDSTQQVVITAKDLTGSTGVNGSGVEALSDTNGSGTLASIGSIDVINNAIQNVATMRANNGAEQSRLGFASEVLTTNKANLQAANSRITDVDVAQESTQLARWNVLVQSGTAMLAQANQSAQTALRLIQ